VKIEPFKQPRAHFLLKCSVFVVNAGDAVEGVPDGMVVGQSGFHY